ncbi:hypothetical protein BH10BAC6_BH10BAC6_06610 [soil metagenome]
MKIPISKHVTGDLHLLCIAVSSAGLFGFCFYEQERVDHRIVLSIVFGMLALLFTWLLLDDRNEFAYNNKSRKADRLLQLPFSTSSTLSITVLSSLLVVGGLSVGDGDADFLGSIPMLLVGLSAFVLTAIAVEHPRIWFSDSFDIESMIEACNNTQQVDHSKHQDGIFSYSDSSFTLQYDSESKTIRWEEICSINAYKIDLFTVDCIVIEILLADDRIAIDDQTIGHMNFMQTASAKLANFKMDWFEVVAFPAFERNLTTVYERPHPSANDIKAKQETFNG